MRLDYIKDTTDLTKEELEILEQIDQEEFDANVAAEIDRELYEEEVEKEINSI